MYAHRPGRYQYMSQWQGAYNALLREAHLPPSAPQNMDLRDDEGRPVTTAVRTQMAVIETMSEFSPDQTEEITHAIKTETVDQWVHTVMNGANFRGMIRTLEEFNGHKIDVSDPVFLSQITAMVKSATADGTRPWNGADDTCEHYESRRPLWCGLRDRMPEIKAQASQQTQIINAQVREQTLRAIRENYEKSGMTKEQIDRQIEIVKQTIH